MRNSKKNMINPEPSVKKMVFKNGTTPINICGYSNITNMPATTIRLYNPISDKLESVEPYSRKAKIIYRSYIEVLDWSPDQFLPTGLQFKNNRFRLTQKTRPITQWKNKSRPD